MPVVPNEVCQECVFSQVKEKCQHKWGANGQDFSFLISDGKGGCRLRNSTKKVEITPEEANPTLPQEVIP